MIDETKISPNEQNLIRNILDTFVMEYPRGDIVELLIETITERWAEEGLQIIVHRVQELVKEVKDNGEYLSADELEERMSVDINTVLDLLGIDRFFETVCDVLFAHGNHPWKIIDAFMNGLKKTDNRERS